MNSDFAPVSKEVSMFDDDGHATGVDYSAGETIADVLLEVGGVQVTEIIGGKRTVSVPSADLLLLSMMPTPEELAIANDQLGLPPGTITTDSTDTGKPFVFILIGNYKIPIGPFIPVLQFDRFTFNFVIGISFIEIVLPQTSGMEDTDAFPFFLGTYGDIRVHPTYQREAHAQTRRVADRAAPITIYEDASVDVQSGNNNYYTNSSPNEINSTAYGGAMVTSRGGGGQLIINHNKQPATPLSTRIASGITGVGRIAGSALVKGSVIIAGGIGAGAGLFISKTRPCEQPLNVPPKVKSRLEMTRRLTKGAAVVSGAMATSALSVATVVGTVIGTGATEYLVGDKKDANANPTGRAAFEVGAALLSSGAIIFSSLLDAKTNILCATGDNITKIVTHKLGDEAGGATGNACGIVYDGINAATMMRGGVVRKVAFAAAKTTLDQHKELQAVSSQQQQLQYHSGPAGTF